MSLPCSCKVEIGWGGGGGGGVVSSLSSNTIINNKKKPKKLKLTKKLKLMYCVCGICLTDIDRVKLIILKFKLHTLHYSTFSLFTRCEKQILKIS